MTDQKMDKYRAQVSEDAGVSETAQKLTDLDNKLEPHKGKMFVKLGFRESSYAEQIAFGVTDEGDEFSGSMLYNCGTSLITGVFTGIKYEKGTLRFEGKDVYDWEGEFLYLHKGPSSRSFSSTLSIDSQVIPEKDGCSGVLVWNGNLPVAYTDCSMLDRESVLSAGEKYAPDSLPESGLESVAIVLGEDAVAELFGIEGKEFTDIKKFYGTLLASMGMDASILEEWDSENQVRGDFSANARLFDALKEKVITLPENFFKQGIFDKYEIQRPEGYNMSFGQRMDELLKKAKEETKEA